MSTVEVRFEGLEQILKKLDPKFLGKPVRDFLERAGITAMNKAKERAPWDSGRLASSLGKMAPGSIWIMDIATPPLSLEVGSSVNAAGFGYPEALDQSPLYHYKGGRAQGKMAPGSAGATPARPTMGVQTRGWFSEAPALLAEVYNRCVQQMAKEIEQALGD